jgi:uncharacterized membrane protein
MSLRDTIEGARAEASQLSGKTEPETPAKKGAQRGSAANAKPAREKAASVRTVSKDGKKAAAMASSLPGAKKTKEQKEAERAERRKQREEEDYRNQAFQLMLAQNPDYKKTERLWWVLLGIGFVATLVSLVITFVFPVKDGNYGSTSGVVSIACLILAYVFIVASFVFDWVKRRPIRKDVEKKMAGMSNKKLAELFAKERKAELERNAAKEAAKAAKKK